MSAMIWIPSQTDAWEPVQVVTSDPTTVTVKRRGVDVKIQGSLAAFDTVTQQSLDESCENLVDLESYNEGIILHHIKKRFVADKIYTLVGNILIALNPYKSIDIYGPQVIDKIYQRVSRNEDPTPHVFTIAATAVYNMRQDKKDQSVLISGESGAGKTEATKKILQFISTVCSSAGSRVGVSIENQILDSNPLLESFGNAKTIRNNNSSRFGKYMEVNFDKKSHIKGCNITAYLLEKSRVVKPGPDERNYHIFYMLLAGANKDMKKDFSLKPPDQFLYLTSGNCLEIEHRSDANEFEELVFAMNNLAIDENCQYSIFKCLAAILHLGNIAFAASKDVEGGSKVTSPSDCRRIAMLLGLESEALEKSLCNKDAVVNGETLSIPLNPEKAADQRDSLAKYVYGKLFDYIVYRVNSSLFRGKHGPSIGVLDIFGFEVFKVNSFEQLCINYCNERLQTFFNEIIFENEMKMYALEGLPIDDISFQDNIGCVRLIDLRGAGIFAYLDEEVAVPKGSDEKFVSKINQIFDENANTKSIFYVRNNKSNVAFTVRHFAGDVHYDATNFLEKNRDAIAESLMNLLNTSNVTILTQPITPINASGPAAADAKEGGGKKKQSNRMTLCAKFKIDLDNLMNILRSTVPHFVRCVKPNMEQVANKFDPVLALNQLKYSGLFEAIRIRKSGYEVRINHDLFVKRYKHIIPFNQQFKEMLKKVNALSPPGVTGGDINQDHWKEASDFLLQKMNEKFMQENFWIERKKQMEKSLVKGGNKKGGAAAAASATTTTTRREHCVGKTKIFLRSQTTKLLFDELREASRGNVVVQIQKIIRGFVQRCRMYHIMGEQKRLREEQRSRERNETAKMRKEDELSMASEQIFRNDKGLQTRLKEAREKRAREEKEKQAKRRMKAILTIQRYFRGYFYRKRSRVFICERLLELALQSHDDKLIEKAIHRPKQWKVTSKLIQHYRKYAKQLILEVMHEGYVENKLQEAILIKSIPLLKEGIALVKEKKMTYLKAYPAARQMLDMLLTNRRVLAIMSDEISKCLNMTILMSKYDVLEYLIVEATNRQMSGDTLVIDVATRLKRVSNLLNLRQRLRHAIEICSPTKMARFMEERKGYVKIFGEEFLAQEANAVDNMFTMLRYQQTLLNVADSVLPSSMKQLHDSMASLNVEEPNGEDGKEEEGEGNGEEKAQAQPENSAQRLTMHEIYKYVINSNIGTVNEEDDYDIDGDFAKLERELIYLPKFVRDPLHKMRLATSQTDLTKALAEYVKLVPNEFHRKFYLRIFKWTMAFGVWNKPNPQIEAIRAKLAADEEEDEDDEPFEDNSVSGSQQGDGMPIRGLPPPPSKTFSSYASTVSSSTSGRKKSPSKVQQKIGTMGRSVSTLSTVSHKKKKDYSSNTPFAERQSKSTVAAREILKKGTKYHFRNYAHETDCLINESISELDKFCKSIHRTSKW